MAPTGDNAVVPNINIEKTFSMKSGKGESSYANNSQAQAKVARLMLHLLKETLDGVVLRPSETPFVVADLGCSTGGNSIYTVEVIIKHMIRRYQEAGCQTPEFSAFFSDLPSNDFNMLFQLLPPYGGGSMEECLASDAQRPYFAAGVPGSFYRRLFPAKSVDVFYSAFALHWLSKVPDEVLDKKSTAYNKGRVFIHGANESTANAYKKQFQSDMASFLSSRSKEMKRGGSMFLAFFGRTCSDPPQQGGAGFLFGTHFQDAWDDLVQEGLITAEKRDNFNIPIYGASLEDFKEVVEADGSFTINKLDLFRSGSPLMVNHPDDAAEVGRALVNLCRSVGGVLVDAHIGEGLSDELFSCMARRAASQAEELLAQDEFHHIVASLSLAK